MNYLELGDVIRYNQQGPQSAINGALKELDLNGLRNENRTFQAREMPTYQNDLNTLLASAQGRGLDSQTNRSSGAYFLNENVIGGEIVPSVLGRTNQVFMGNSIFTGVDKLKLGPGIGLVRPPELYGELLAMGMKPALEVNYAAPGGTTRTRQGIADIVNASIGQEAKNISPDGCFVTAGATEGIQVALQAQKEIDKGRIVFLGPGYYAGPLAAQRLELPYERRISSCARKGSGLLPDPTELGDLPPDTKMVVVSLPNNPDGSDYDENQLQSLVRLAQEKNINILFDGIFDDLRYENPSTTPLLRAAEQQNGLDRIVTVSSLSKATNLAGDRIGWLATSNPIWADKVNEIFVDRRCNPRLTLEPLFAFEGLARQVSNSSPANESEIRKLYKQLKQPNDTMTDVKFCSMYLKLMQWKAASSQYYRDNLTIAKDLWTAEGTADMNISPDLAGFNTFPRMNVPLGTNTMGYLAEQMVATGLYTQAGPCFGVSQQKWDDDLGVRERISFASDREDLVNGLIRGSIFNRVVQSKGLSTTVQRLNYDQQI
ncbi:MAG: pyridoxal phosphate-dependent aminotransferase [Candidatus Roizmanbacteria bacterium]